jgi:hypothetical protein
MVPRLPSVTKIAGSEELMVTADLTDRHGSVRIDEPQIETETRRVRYEGKPSAFFDFQLVLIVSNELLDFVRHREELVPLLLVESDRKPAQPVDGNCTFFAHFHRYSA